MYTKIALLVAVACGAALLGAQPADEKPVWHADWASAQRIAQKENRAHLCVMVCKH